MREVYRILDANLNRAREALRVAEDYARFLLDDPALSGTCKSLRSELQQIAQALPADALLAARDTPGDVGTAITTDTERARPDPSAVVSAACKRLSEALRTLEEYAKLVAPPLAGRLEALRYRSYGLEPRMRAGGERRRRFGEVRLYLLLTRNLCRHDPLATARAALAGGVGCLQVREKTTDAGALLAWCHQVRALTDEAGALLIVNDRPDVASLCGADGVHLGQDDLPAGAVRSLLGPERLIGVSTHSLAQARTAQADGADYIGVGPMFATTTKDAGPIQGPALLAEVARNVDVPQVAIGGITADNAPQLVAAGGRCVAVCGAILQADDPKRAAETIRAAMA